MRRAAALLLGLFALLMLAIVLAADRRALPGFVMRLYAFPGGDKVGHFVLFGLFALLAAFATGHRRVRVRYRPRKAFTLPVGGNVVALLATLEELTQALFPSRTFSLLDWLATLAGIASATWLATTIHDRQRNRGPDA